MEEKVVELVKTHNYMIYDWLRLQNLLKTAGLEDKLTDEHLRWVLEAKCQVRVIKTGSEAGKLLKHPDPECSWWVENGTRPPKR